MSIQYIKYADLDFNKWDTLIEEALNGLPYAYSWFLDIVAQEWDALVLGDYEAVMPLPFNKKLPLTLQIYQPHFAQQLGVFSRNAISPALLEQMQLKIPKQFKRVDLHFNYASPTSTLTQKNNLILDLNSAYESLFKNYAGTLRNELRKAKKVHHFVKEPINTAALIARYREEQGNKVAYDDHSYQNLQKLIDQAIAKKKGFIAGAEDASGELRAVGFFLQSNNRIINLLATSDYQARKLKSMHFLLDSLIEQHSERGYIFDFEGSNVPSIAKFFSRFGAKEQPYFHYRRDNLPALLGFALWAKGKISG